jgi:hypothetical protein
MVGRKYSLVDYSPTPYRRHQALPNKEDGSPLKAILAHDALVHPDHPLRNGKHGIEMYMGDYLYQCMVSRLVEVVCRNTSEFRNKVTVFISPSGVHTGLAFCHEVDQDTDTSPILGLSFDRVKLEECVTYLFLKWRRTSELSQGMTRRTREIF